MRLMLILLTLCAMASLAFADTVYIPDDFEYIQDAIHFSMNGDTIIVRPGLYAENIDFMGRAITVKSELGPEVTIIDGGYPADPDYGSVVLFEMGEGSDSVLEGFTLTNGSGTVKPGSAISVGGGICCIASSPAIVGNIITGNRADDGAGIGGQSDAQPVITGNTIYENLAQQGGGINLSGSLAGVVSSNSIRDNEVFNRGGGIYLEHSSVSISGNLIERNHAVENEGGGIYAGAGGHPLIGNNTILDNVAAMEGGGIYAASSYSTIENNTLEGNQATRGAGIYASSGNGSQVLQNRICRNTATTSGGGIHCNSRYSLISHNFINSNSAFQGGGIECEADEITVISNIISDNTATSFGGGIWRLDDDLSILNNLIVRNTAEYGGGIACRSAGTVTVVNNTIVANSATYGGGINSELSCGPEVMNTILWGNQAQEGKEIRIADNYKAGTFKINYSDVEGGMNSVFLESGASLIWGAFMIDAPPSFADPGSDDYHLTITSPCVNAGDDFASYIPADDFEGDLRIVGDDVDMGFDEFSHHLYHVGPVTPGETIEIKVVGLPSTKPVTLAVSDTLLDPPTSTQWGDLYIPLPPGYHWNGGPIPRSGIQSNAVTIPLWWSAGEKRYIQALLGPMADPDSVLTNPLVLEVE